jgi:hypothetical protein
LVRNLQRRRSNQDTTATSGIDEVGMGDVVFVLAGRKLHRQRHLYRFAWLDAGASAAWVEERLGPLLADRVDSDLEHASFVVAVVCGKRAALYVASPPTLPGGDLRGSNKVHFFFSRSLSYAVFCFVSALNIVLICVMHCVLWFHVQGAWVGPFPSCDAYTHTNVFSIQIPSHRGWHGTHARSTMWLTRFDGIETGSSCSSSGLAMAPSDGCACATTINTHVRLLHTFLPNAVKNKQQH